MNSDNSNDDNDYKNYDDAYDDNNDRNGDSYDDDNDGFIMVMITTTIVAMMER